MSTTLTEDTTAVPTNTKTHAMLVRGRVYMLREVTYEFNVPMVTSAEDIRHLRRHGVDTISLEGENEFQLRPKFKFLTSVEAEKQRLKNVSEGAPDDTLIPPDEDYESEDEPVNVPVQRTTRSRTGPRDNG